MSGLGAYPGLVKRCPQIDGESSLRLVPAEVSSCKAIECCRGAGRNHNPLCTLKVKCSKSKKAIETYSWCNQVQNIKDIKDFEVK